MFNSLDVTYYCLFVGVLLLCLTPVGVTLNLLVIILFTKRKKTKSRTSYLLKSLAVSDGTMAAVGGSMYLTNAFSHRWVFQKEGKQLLPTTMVSNYYLSIPFILFIVT